MERGRRSDDAGVGTGGAHGDAQSRERAGVAEEATGGLGKAPTNSRDETVGGLGEREEVGKVWFKMDSTAIVTCMILKH